jgi:hypothetical protein
MPLTAYILIVTVLFPFSVDENIAFIALGALIMGAVPAGTTSNLFTYFSKGNLALSVMMTINSTLWAFIMTPLMLFIYANFLSLDDTITIEFTELATVIVGLIIPVGLGMLVRRLSANAGSVLELVGGLFGVLFIPFLIAIWVPRNWQLLLDTEWPTYTVAIGLGLVGITVAFWIAKAIGLHPANVRTIAERTTSNCGYCGRIHRQSRTGQDLASSCTVLAVHRANFNRCHICVQKGQLGSRAEDPKPALGINRKQTPTISVGVCFFVLKPWKVLGKLTGVVQVSRHQIT